MLQVRVGTRHQQTPRFLAIVHSGSPYCIFKKDVADILGIDLAKCPESMLYGMNQSSEPAFFHKVKIYIEADWIIEVMAGFCKKLAATGILGRNGFFDNFHIRFDHSAAPPVLDISRIQTVQ
jgi:hypothetical protein